MRYPDSHSQFRARSFDGRRDDDAAPGSPRPERRRRGDFPGFGGPGLDGPGFDGPRGSRHHGGPGGHGGRGSGGPRGRGRGPGRRAGRGDIRSAVLLLLAEQPMHGYQLIQEIAERSGGAWRPSPGAVYPALSLLEDEGLVAIASESGRKQATLTEAGTAYVSENADALGDPWQAAAERGGDSARTLRTAFEGIADAARQVARSGSESQAKSAEAILDKARRDLYLVLAGEAETPGDSEG